MAYSYTGIAYLLLFLATAILAYRFYQYWRKKRNVISKLFFCMMVPYNLFLFMRAITGLFFVDNIQILRISFIAAPFLQALGSAVAVCIVILCLKLPRFLSRLGFSLLILLGIATTYMSYTINFQPVAEIAQSIDWDVGKFDNFYLSLRALIFLLGMAPLAAVLLKQYSESVDHFVRARALGLGLLFLFAVVISLLDYFSSETFIRDIFLIIMGIALLATIIFTQRTPISANIKEDDK